MTREAVGKRRKKTAARRDHPRHGKRTRRSERKCAFPKRRRSIKKERNEHARADEKRESESFATT